jgi:transposase
MAEATKAVKEQGLSPTAVARDLGVDVSTVVAWLALEGIATDRRPKKLKPAIYAQLLQLLEGGASKEMAASWAGVSTSTITKLLRSQPGLRARWNATRLSATRAQHQKTWQELLDRNPSSSIPVLRTVAAKAYAWLYRNERGWLNASIAARASLPQRPRTRIDWDARDDLLASEVRKAAEQICAITGRERCTVASICASVPDLRAKLGAIDQLPRTARAIREATWPRRRREYGTLL